MATGAPSGTRLFLALLLSGLVPSAAAGGTLRSDTKTYVLTNTDRVRLEFPVGKLRVEPGSSDTVQTTVLFHCRDDDEERCERRARRIRLDPRQRGRTFELEVRGFSKFTWRGSYVECRVQVPESLPLVIEMGVGELQVLDLRGHLDLHLGIGEAHVELSEPDVGSVALKVGIGEAAIRSRDGRRGTAGLFGRRMRWQEGSGNAHVDLSVGIGEAGVRLR